VKPRTFLALAARRPLLALAALIAGVWLAVTAASALRGDDASKNPRLILGRVWFDRYPEKRTDSTQVLIFLAGGIGLHESGSVYRSSFDLFEFERQGDKVSLAFLQDRKTAETRFTVTPCDERPPFDLCLDFTDSPRGPKRYYGFGDEDEMARKIPWGRPLLRAAEGRAAAK
jgi:hypothetical protein